ncbi:MAG: cysteine desulfurase [Eggerthellaceae bacterium]|nr:cysteine desulfurase [Eggerthellaceae bacterium]
MLESLFPHTEFPILDREVGRAGQRLTYLDSAASSLVPERVLRRVVEYYRSSCSNIHRGAHLLAEESTGSFEDARSHIASFLHVGSAEQVIFTHGATESLNMVARCWAAHALKPGDTVLVAEDNHHANIVCWHMLARENGLKVGWIPLGTDGILDQTEWLRLLEARPKLVALTHLSNVLGYEQPGLGQLISDARAAGARVALDAAQSVGHMPVDFQGLAVDFLAFSAHKAMGLGGFGVLACSPGARGEMEPAYGGGGMVERVGREGFLPADAPRCFEAGTPAIAAAVACSEALALVGELGLGLLARHTEALCTKLVKGLAHNPRIAVLGAHGLKRNSIVSFTVEGIHPHDISQRLSDHYGIAVRAGHHCAMPLHAALRTPASVRASVAGYSEGRDIQALLDALAEVTEGTGRRT